MKALLIKFAAWVLTKYAADAMVKAQEVAYAKGKNSYFYKTLVDVGTKVGTILKEVATAGRDNVLSEEEAARCRAMWQDIADELAEVIAGE
jgi:hypothetical protein